MVLKLLERDGVQESVQRLEDGIESPGFENHSHTVLTAYVPALHNHSQHNRQTPHPVIDNIVLLMMGIMMPETC